MDYCVEVWHLRNVGGELLYMTYKFMQGDTLRLLGHIGETKLLVLSRIDGKHGEKLELLCNLQMTCMKLPLVLSERPLKVNVGIGCCLLSDKFVPHVHSLY
jgi:hypothetical protein